MDVKENKRITESSSSWILLPEQMDVLKRKPYLYNATAGSFLELLFLQRYWMWLVKFIPLRLAPCVLTCFGLVINLFCCFTLLCYISDSKSEAPSWTFVLCAIGVFLYQTLDALDGKQAIKVQNTQIEEVYDHGCDAISTVFVALSTSYACQLTMCPTLMFSFFLASVLAFYSTHWQDHVTHVMIFGRVDVSEAQFSVIIIHLITAYFGQHVWQMQLFFGVELRHFLCVISVLMLIRSIWMNVCYVLGTPTPLDDFVKIPRKKGSQIWNPLVPVTILTTFALRVYTAGLFDISPCIFVITFGLAYAKITMKLVMANVTYADMDFWDSSLIGPFLLCLNTYIVIHLPNFSVSSYTALLCGLVYNLMDIARYFTYISWDLRDALDVWIFSLKYLPGHPKCRNGNLGVYLNGLNNNEMWSNAKNSTIKDQDTHQPSDKQKVKTYHVI